MVSVYRNISEALGVPWEPSHEIEETDLYEHKMCRIPGVPHDEISKQLIAEKTKAYWASPAGQAKKQRLIEWNKKTKSEVMRRTWQENPDAIYRGGRPKGSKDRKKRKDAIRRKARRVITETTIYHNIYDAADHCGIAVSTVKKRCRLNINGWRYE